MLYLPLPNKHTNQHQTIYPSLLKLSLHCPTYHSSSSPSCLACLWVVIPSRNLVFTSGHSLQLKIFYEQEPDTNTCKVLNLFVPWVEVAVSVSQLQFEISQLNHFPNSSAAPAPLKSRYVIESSSRTNIIYLGSDIFLLIAAQNVFCILISIFCVGLL